MTKYIIRRILVSIPVVFLMILATFLLVQAMPGGPFDTVGTRAMPEQMREIMERRYGLDKPVYEQFFVYFFNLMRGDFGPMLRLPGQTVNDIVAQTFPVSFQLGFLSVILAFVLGIPIGIIAALNHNSSVDYAVTFLAVLGRSVPNLVLAPIMIYLFGVKLKWFPIAFWGANPPFFLGVFPPLTWDFIYHAIMPTVALGTGMAAGIARLTRAGLLDVLSQDYIRTARAKGLRDRTVIVVHALKNSLIPVVTILGPMLASVLTGTLVLELIFALNGMGRQFVNSINAREYFLQTSLTLIFGLMLVAGNLLVDVMYAWFDPRIRYD
ncbi:MAG: ABC transporter permease [Anaerolineales bacterium]|nr:ABC transporter permease [Anaerolineales bacterium]